MIDYFHKYLLRAVNIGADGFDEKTARKIQIINIVTLIAIFFLALVTVFMYQLDDWSWKQSAWETGILLILIIPVLFADRFGYIAKLSVFILWFLVFLGTQILNGKQNGLHLFLLITPVVLLFFLGSARKYAAGILTIGATLLFLLIYYMVPDEIWPSDALYDALKIPFIDQFNFRGNDFIFIVVVVVLEIILFITTYIAFSAVEKSEAALEREYARSELLLQSLLPKSIALRLKDHPDDVIADQFEDVSILFADIEGFTKRSSEQSADKIVGLLNRVFSEFDKLADKHGLEKIKTIGDAYMVAGGLPEKRAGHASALAEMALDMIEAVENLSVEIDEKISVRVGLHSGPAVAGVIGRQKPFYDVWGDTINIASRMESSGSAGRIQITPELKDILGVKYKFEERGVVNIKGKGKMNPYYLIGRS